MRRLVASKFPACAGRKIGSGTGQAARNPRKGTGSVLLFVDDDNVLQSDYLREALRIAREWPILGAWGGHVEGVFEIEPSSEVLEYLWMLGVRNVAIVQWSNATFDNHAVPNGAGMCVRRPVALRYATAVTNSPYRQRLDREGGTGLVSGGDTDLALTACDAGLGGGLFPTLVVRHLIPRHRVEPQYIIRLAENIAYGQLLVRSVPSRITAADSLLRPNIYVVFYSTAPGHSSGGDSRPVARTC